MCSHLATKYKSYTAGNFQSSHRSTVAKNPKVHCFTKQITAIFVIILTIVRRLHHILLPNLAAKAGFAMVETGSKHSPSLFSSSQNNLDLIHVVLLEKYPTSALNKWANHVIFKLSFPLVQVILAEKITALLHYDWLRSGQLIAN